ncbi:hypothetical protein Kpol_463p4 [Vanderwaltozyma polyspora DSM 70294]|uniref:NTR2 n=1 Tax=Vanderwaltozyma polyspora (strain ATCC 22028 / DSM 70294 / BCRC 21397 / CBS 2163 / NBRC 10782 / NRRL Y-8283 / UCD 57-17) TaxID=436907 RepID=A7TQJ1_VANPO|nr:uncharacterized protein Kpol_463p4 [Vanderwaltozyma polyspora DSM 70294]EDO15455.1 hypothetical protein Kpol_463p4 [Vanderwaltozyma polyspora DSM 70294]
MAFIKRNKIRLSGSSNKGKVSATISGNGKVRSKVSLDYDEIDEEPVEVKPLKLVKKRNDEDKRNAEIATSGKIEEYSDIFHPSKNNDDSKILNLSDMSDVDVMDSKTNDCSISDNDNVIPSKELIERLKSERRKLSEKPRNFGKVNEREYVKLLDKDDEVEIMEIIEKNGGKQKKNENDYIGLELDLGEFEDNRLALSSKEKLLESERRKDEIMKAVEVDSQSHESDGDSWQEQIIKRSTANVDSLQDGNIFDSKEFMVSLPTLSDDSHLEGIDIKLSEMMSSFTVRKKQLETQIKILENQKENTELNIIEILKKFKNVNSDSML